MWNLIGHISKKWKKCAVVLTTHSMEEAEALFSLFLYLLFSFDIFSYCFYFNIYIF